MALLMALHMALHMASQIMAPDPMASLKDMASSLLLMVNNLPTLSSLSILKVLQLDLNRRPRGSVSSSAGYQPPQQPAYPQQPTYP